MMKLLIDDIDNVLSPIGGSGRVKYTCLDVSKRYLVLGANTGSLYFFERKSTSTIISKSNQIVNTPVQSVVIPNTGIVISGNSFNNDNLSFTQILSLNDVRDPIQSIKINPTNDNIVAICSVRTVYVIEPNISTRREKEKIIFKMTDHPKDSEITCIAWSPCGGYLFSGDDLGNIYCSSVAKARRSLGSFFFSAELAFKCDSRLVQLDVLSIRPSLEVALTQVPHIAVALLPSTLTKSSVITYQVNQSTNVGKSLGVIHIGKKQRENTKQGACFHKFYRNSLYASRPGKRLWLADRLDGKVLSTMNFSTEEGAQPVKPKPLCTESLVSSQLITGNHTMIFSKLLPYGNLVISWDEKSLLLVDVSEVEVLEWRLEVNQIFDVCIHEGSIYVLHGSSRSISRVYSSIPLPSNPTLDEDIIVHEQPQQTYIEEPKESKEIQENIQQVQQVQQIQPPPILPSNTTTDITDYSNTETSTNDSNINTDTDNISLTNSTGSINDNIDDNTSTTEVIKENVVLIPTVVNSTPIPTSTTSTTTTTQQNTTITPIQNTTSNGLPRIGSKVNLFSDIRLSSEPLVTLTSGGPSVPKENTPPQPRKTVIKKKVIKVNSSTDSTTTTTNTTTPPSTASTSPISTSPLSKSQDLFEDNKNSNSTGTTINPNEPKRTVIIKKKIVKKPKSTGTEPTNQDSSTNNSTNTPLNTTPEKKSPSTVPTTTTTAAPTTTTDTGIMGQGIFSTAVSSFQKINQIANKIQKQTSEIRSDLTQKILGSHETIPNNVDTTQPIDNLNQSNTTFNQIPFIEESPLEILDKLTKKTHEALLEFKIQKKESVFLPILLIWISAFHNCTNITSSEGNQSPVVLPNEQINNIVTTCFLLGINLTSKDCTEQICRCWGETNAKEFIHQYSQYLDKNKVIMSCNYKGWDECIDALMDVELQTLSKQDSKVIATINQFVDSGNSNSAFTLLEQQSHTNYSMLFRYLSVLINLDSLRAASFFSKHYPTVTPHNVFKLMTNSSNAPSKIEYLRHLITEQQDCKYDPKLIMEWFTTCISQLPLDQTLYRSDLIEGNDRVPVLNSHTIEWKYRDTMMTIIQNVISNEYFGNIESLERQSRENGFWEGLLKIYLHCYESYSSKSLTFNQSISDNYARKAIDLIIFTDNKFEFIKFFENNTNIEHWSIALNSMENLRNIYLNSINGEKELLFEISELQIAKIMGRAIGPLQTIELISNSKLFSSQDSSKISPIVLSEWVRNGKWSLYNRAKLSYDILNGLDSHLWLKKPLTISPQILSLIGPEIDKSLPQHPFLTQSNNSSDHIHNHLNENTLCTADKFEFGIMPQFFEDNARRHWGIETELHSGVCLICTLPLTENPESSFLGSTPAIIIVFPNCGHAYHQVCIEEQGCSLCFSKR